MVTKKGKLVLLLFGVLAVLLLLTFLPSRDDEESGPDQKNKYRPTDAETSTSPIRPRSGSSRSGEAKKQRAQTDTKPSKQVLFQATWGDGPDQLGKRMPENGAPEGPMSFFVTDDGASFILDQVNKRLLLVRDGKAAGSIDIGSDTYQELAVQHDTGRLFLLDRLAAKRVDVLDETGNRLSGIPIEGRGVPEGGGVTGLFLHQDGVYVEYEHSSLVRIAGSDGRPDATRATFMGRPSPDGSMFVTARIEHPSGVVLQVQAKGSDAAAPVVVSFPKRIAYIMDLAFDTHNRIYLAARLLDPVAAPPGEPPLEQDEVVSFDQAGHELSRLSLPDPEPDFEAEQFRSIRIGSDGSVYQLVLSSQGATLIKWMMP